MPDFDIDFCQDRRDEVINYVTDKYGQDNVGQIITFGSLKAKSVLRDVAACSACRSPRATRSPSWCPRSSTSP